MPWGPHPHGGLTVPLAVTSANAWPLRELPGGPRPGVRSLLGWRGLLFSSSRPSRRLPDLSELRLPPLRAANMAVLNFIASLRPTALVLSPTRHSEAPGTPQPSPETALEACWGPEGPHVEKNLALLRLLRGVVFQSLPKGHGASNSGLRGLGKHVPASWITCQRRRWPRIGNRRRFAFPRLARPGSRTSSSMNREATTPRRRRTSGLPPTATPPPRHSLPSSSQPAS